MRNEEINGIGSVREGEYDRVGINGVGRIRDKVSVGLLEINGMGKLRGQVQADQVVINGAGKGKGRLTAQRLTINGAGRWFRPLRADQLEVNGLLKLRRANLSGKRFAVSGLLVCNREITADEIIIEGVCSAAKLYGDVICFHREGERSAVGAHGQLPGPAQWLIRRFPRLYFGRSVSLSRSLVDQLECTQLEASNLTAKVVRTGRAVLTNGCSIKRLYCDGEIQADPSCWIGEIISNGKVLQNNKEGAHMADNMLVKILDLYKEERIDADEAEQMLRTLGKGQPAGEGDALPWPDDRRLRIVAFLGRKLLKKGEPAYKDLTVAYEGKAVDVECWGSLRCGDVQGDAQAGSSVQCGDVGGDVCAGAGVSCGEVQGDVQAGSSVQCSDVGGGVCAGAGVSCSDVTGSVTADAHVACKDTGDRATGETEVRTKP